LLERKPRSPLIETESASTVKVEGAKKALFRNVLLAVDVEW
jgi:hypothetical protein